eukprot:COSAG02_NODE_5313_length_4446_cov_11.536922_3_plen_119_part_00
MVEDANSDKEDQSFREGLAQKLLETNKTKAKANFAHCFIKGKNDVLLGDKANGAGHFKLIYSSRRSELPQQPQQACRLRCVCLRRMQLHCRALCARIALLADCHSKYTPLSFLYYAQL